MHCMFWSSRHFGVAELASEFIHFENVYQIVDLATPNDYLSDRFTLFSVLFKPPSLQLLLIL